MRFKIGNTVVNLGQAQAQITQAQYCRHKVTYLNCVNQVTGWGCHRLISNGCHLLVSDPCHRFITDDPCHQLISDHPCHGAISGGGCGPAWSTCFRSGLLDRTEIIRTSPVLAEDPAESLEILDSLKADLKAELELLDQQVETIQATAQPKSLEEVEALEAQLEDSLKDVKAMKDRFKKK